MARALCGKSIAAKRWRRENASYKLRAQTARQAARRRLDNAQNDVAVEQIRKDLVFWE